MEKKTYTKDELRDFYKELQPYRVSKTLSNKEVVSFIDFDAYLCDKGALVRREGSYAPAIVEARMGLYLELDDKWEQLRAQLNKVAFAKFMQTKELAALEGV